MICLKKMACRSVNALLLAVALSLVGCQTPVANPISKDKTVAVSVETKDLLLYAVRTNEISTALISKKVEKSLVNLLSKKGIKTEANDAFKNGDAKLTLNLDSIETIITMAIPLFAPVATEVDLRIRYTMTVVSSDGSVLGTVEDRHDDASLAKLTSIIGEKAGKQALRYFK